MNVPRSIARRRRRTHCLVIAVTALTLCTCAPAPPRAIIYNPPKAATRQSSAVPALEQLRKLNTDADSRSSKVADGVGLAKTGIDSLGDRLAELAATSAGLSNLPSVPGTTLSELNRQLVVREQEARKLSADLTHVTADLGTERDLRRAGGVQLIKADSQVRDKEREADALRDQLAEAVGANLALQQAANANAAAATKASARAEKLQGEINLWRRLCVGAVVIVVGLLAFGIFLRGAAKTINPLA